MRRRAYQGLAGYSLDALEEMEALRALQDYAAPLLGEADAGARGAAGALADAALAYEHANRRRCCSCCLYLRNFASSLTLPVMNA